jgi:Ca-activated chloride channel family protein
VSILDWSSTASAAESLPPFPAALLSALSVLTTSLSVATAVRRLGRKGVDLRRTSTLFHRFHPVVGALAVLCLVIAAFNPKIAGGTKVVPRTPLDIVFVLDVSKSMYAEDVSPSRLVAARAAVEGVIDRFPQARFGGVAFAGEPFPFPLTTDGPALYGQLRDVEPDAMPVGGTATGRALHAARELFQRDPYASEHERIVLLITDGDDQQGGLDEAATALANAGITLHVAAVGGRTPVPVPVHNTPSPSPSGGRARDGAHPLLSGRSADGEAALARAAVVGHGEFFPAKRGIVDLTPFSRAVAGRVRGALATREVVSYRGLAPEFGVAGLLILCADLGIALGLRRRRSVDELVENPWAGKPPLEVLAPSEKAGTAPR